MGSLFNTTTKLFNYIYTILHNFHNSTLHLSNRYFSITYGSRTVQYSFPSDLLSYSLEMSD